MKRLTEILESMDLPKSRIAPKIDARWLLRNIRVRNASHPHLGEAVALLTEILNP